MAAIKDRFADTYISQKDAEDHARGYVLTMAALCALGIICVGFLAIRVLAIPEPQTNLCAAVVADLKPQIHTIQPIAETRTHK